MFLYKCIWLNAHNQPEFNLEVFALYFLQISDLAKYPLKTSRDMQKIPSIKFVVSNF